MELKQYFFEGPVHHWGNYWENVKFLQSNENEKTELWNTSKAFQKGTSTTICPCWKLRKISNKSMIHLVLETQGKSKSRISKWEETIKLREVINEADIKTNIKKPWNSARSLKR